MGEAHSAEGNRGRGFPLNWYAQHGLQPAGGSPAGRRSHRPERSARAEARATVRRKRGARPASRRTETGYEAESPGASDQVIAKLL